MTNVKHDLRHDKDGMILYTHQVVTDIVPFDPAWVEAEGPCAGLPTKVGVWIKDNVEIGMTVVGVRWLNFHSYPFQLTRFKNAFRAEFRMPDKRVMRVMPGMIEIARYEPSNELLIRYNEFKVEGGTTWKAWFETKRRYDYNYHDCPSVLGVTFSLIDNMLYEITKVPHFHIARYLYGLVQDDRNRAADVSVGPSVPEHLQELFNVSANVNASPSDVETPIEIEKFYFYLAKHYYFGSGALVQAVPMRSAVADPELFTAFMAVLGSFLHGRKLQTDPFAAYKMHRAHQSKSPSAE